ncbi:MAG: hypothetical protein Q7K43_00125, partial [Candidatus Woesearchaeota archaeon]|nr:hypothetical protein [Candidatus Woesearchaeota archaeon]
LIDEEAEPGKLAPLRKELAEALLGRELTPEEQNALITAHNLPGFGTVAEGTITAQQLRITAQQLRDKLEALKQAFFNAKDRDLLIRSGLAGKPKASVIASVIGFATVVFGLVTGKTAYVVIGSLGILVVISYKLFGPQRVNDQLQKLPGGTRLLNELIKRNMLLASEQPVQQPSIPINIPQISEEDAKTPIGEELAQIVEPKTSPAQPPITPTTKTSTQAPQEPVLVPPQPSISQPFGPGTWTAIRGAVTFALSLMLYATPLGYTSLVFAQLFSAYGLTLILKGLVQRGSQGIVNLVYKTTIDATFIPTNELTTWEKTKSLVNKLFARFRDSQEIAFREELRELGITDATLKKIRAEYGYTNDE